MEVCEKMIEILEHGYYPHIYDIILNISVFFVVYITLWIISDRSGTKSMIIALIPPVLYFMLGYISYDWLREESVLEYGLILLTIATFVWFVVASAVGMQEKEDRKNGTQKHI